jgi:hypothetical protein
VPDLGRKGGCREERERAVEAHIPRVQADGCAITNRRNEGKATAVESREGEGGGGGRRGVGEQARGGGGWLESTAESRKGGGGRRGEGKGRE